MQDIFRRSSGPFFALGLVFLILLSLSLIRDYAVPVAVAIFVWMLINAMANNLTRTPGIGALLPGWGAKLIAVLAIFGAIALAARVIAGNVSELRVGVTASDSVVLAWVNGWLVSAGVDPKVGISGLVEQLELDRLLTWGLGLARSLVSDTALVFLYVLFLLVDQRYTDAKLRALFPDPDRRNDIERTLGRIGSEVRAYVWLMFLISLGVALATYAIGSAIGLKGAGFWAFLAFALNFVPTIGSIAAVVLPALYGVLTLDDPINLGILIGGLTAVQFIAGELVLPKVMGARLNLSSVVILLMLVIWGAMWGPAGMFMAIPLTVIVVLICARFPTSRPIAILLSRDGRLPED